MSHPSLAPTPIRPDLDEGDHDRFAHYARKDEVTRASITGETITAVCGKKFTPTRDPERYPICPTCSEIMASRSG